MNIFNSFVNSKTPFTSTDESVGCMPRESDGDIDAPLLQDGEMKPEDSTHWYDPKSDPLKLYKDRTEGDGFEDGKKTVPWPHPNSPFGDAELARAEGVKLEPYPPVMTPAGRLGLFGNRPGIPLSPYWSKRRRLCATLNTVQRNMITHRKHLVGWGLAIDQSKMIDCILDCARDLPPTPKKPKGGIPGLPPHPDMPQKYPGSRWYEKAHRYELDDGFDPALPHEPYWEEWVLRQCKIYCMSRRYPTNLPRWKLEEKEGGPPSYPDPDGGWVPDVPIPGEPPIK